MNILDVNDNEVTVPDTNLGKLKGIFNRQSELHKKYGPIETRNGIGLAIIEGIPFDLDNPKWQYVIKDYAWRVSEELTEALEAYQEGNTPHTVEELIDALHFYTELLIISGYTAEDVHERFLLASEYEILRPIYPVGLACNLLKNKPWKNTHVPTDKGRFKIHIVGGYICLLNLIMTNYLSSLSDVFMVYFKKSLVNSFRIRSNY